MFSAEITHSKGDLKPFLSSETIEFHYEKHHVGYANTLNSLIKDSELQQLSLEAIIMKSRNQYQKIFNNAAQLFNHNFYWKCLGKGSEGPQGKLLDMIKSQFDNFDKFQQEYIVFAGSMFGSGWSWLVKEDNKLRFLNTINAETPIGTNAVPICVVDLWEHAYYIDYRNDRTRYIANIILSCINWKFCSSCC